MIRHLKLNKPRARSRAFLTMVLTTVALPAIFLSAACSGKHSTPVVQNDEGDSAGKVTLVSALKMSDPSAKEQLAKGFYALEANAWRWTAGSFSVTLKTPPGAAQKGATLALSLTVSDVILRQLHSQTLAASVGATALKSEKYTDPGSHTFTADIPAALLNGDTVTIDFSLDNSLPPGPVDRRELGVIVNSVSIDTD
jgi:hypothetical protein